MNYFILAVTAWVVFLSILFVIDWIIITRKPRTCEEEGCSETRDLVKCRLVMMRFDVSWFWYWRLYGFREAWRIWGELRKTGAADVYDYYCAEHCYKNGYCYACGQFWAGSEDFDFSRSHLCSNCRYEEMEDDEYIDDGSYYSGPYDGEIPF